MQQVKNRAPAQVQVTAEQLIRTAREHQIDDEQKIKLDTHIQDEEELRMHQGEKRREFEEKLRHTMIDAKTYLRYARWEESQLEFRRARSVMERCLEAHNREYKVWISYAEFELRGKFLNHARNVLDRAVTHLPRMNQLWFKYVYVEELVADKSLDKVRLVYERWMDWKPSEQAWRAYIKFEERHGEVARARDLWERLAGGMPTATIYTKYARWEQRQDQLELARRVFERSFEELDPAEAKQEALFIAFARFEEACKEFERARAIYKGALELLPKESSHVLAEAHMSFERQHGDRESIENVLFAKRRARLDEHLAAAPHDVDGWFDLTRLEQAHAAAEALAAEAHASNASKADREYARKLVGEARERVRSVFARAVSHEPPSRTEKRLWLRFVYLYINWATWEELECADPAAARAVYRRCLDAVPHKHFTFSKLWVLAAHLEVREQDLPAARKLLGEGIGRAGAKPDKVIKAYLQLELQLGNVDRVRALYEKFLEVAPHNCLVWQKYAELEASLKETTRARALFDLAIGQPVLDRPETLWKAYIDWETALGSKAGKANARALFKRLLERTQHVKVWVALAKFEGLSADDAVEARRVFNDTQQRLKERHTGAAGSDLDSNSSAIDVKEDRALVLQAWLDTERRMLGKRVEGASEENVAKVEKMQPTKVKKKRQVDDGGWEEYYDYKFFDDPKKGLKLLQMAQKWKQAKKQKTDDANEIDLDL